MPDPWYDTFNYRPIHPLRSVECIMDDHQYCWLRMCACKCHLAVREPLTKVAA